VKIYSGNPRHRSEDDIFDARLRGRRHGNGIAIATQASGDPEDVNF